MSPRTPNGWSLLTRVLLLATLGCGNSGDLSVGGNRLRPSLRSHVAKPADSFVDQLGVNTHFGYPESLYALQRDALVLPALVELGVRHVRENVSAQIARDLPQGGIHALLAFRGHPLEEAIGWAKTLGDTLIAIEGPSDTDYEPEDFSYRGQTFPEGTRAYQDDLFKAVQSDPALAGVAVALPTVYSAANASLLGSLQSGTHCNVHGRRPLGATPGDDAELLLREAVAICGEARPTLATSIGYSTLEAADGGVSELVAAKYLMRSALEYFARGVQRFYVYELINELPDPTGTALDLHRGLLRADGSRKPAFVALSNLIALLSDVGAAFQTSSLSFGLGGQVNDVHQLLLEKRDGSFFLLLWREVPSWDPALKEALNVPESSVELAFDDLMESIEVFQPLASSSAVSSHASVDRVLLPVGDHPLIVRIRRGEGVESR